MGWRDAAERNNDMLNVGMAREMRWNGMTTRYARTGRKERMGWVWVWVWQEKEQKRDQARTHLLPHTPRCCRRGRRDCSINGCTSVGRRGWRSSAAAPDIGLAIVTDATLDTSSTTQHGSCRWMAPELYDPQLESKQRTKASDVMPSHFCV
jgi:hypothetical protein